MKNILVLCTGNSCRSQMAHGYFSKKLGGKAKVYSAGVETHGLNPYAVLVMKMDGIANSNYSSNLIFCIGNYHMDKKIKELMKVSNVYEIKNSTQENMKIIIKEFFQFVTMQMKLAPICQRFLQ